MTVLQSQLTVVCELETSPKFHVSLKTILWDGMLLLYIWEKWGQEYFGLAQGG